MIVIVSCKNEEDPNKNEALGTYFSPIITIWELSVLNMVFHPTCFKTNPTRTETLCRNPPPLTLMLLIKFDSDWLARLRDIHV